MVLLAEPPLRCTNTDAWMDAWTRRGRSSAAGGEGGGVYAGKLSRDVAAARLRLNSSTELWTKEKDDDAAAALIQSFAASVLPPPSKGPCRLRIFHIVGAGARTVVHRGMVHMLHSHGRAPWIGAE